MIKAPDSIEPLIGFREWRFDGRFLTAVYNGVDWLPGENVAHCIYEHPLNRRCVLRLQQQRAEQRLNPYTALAYGTPPDPPFPHSPPHELCSCGFYASAQPTMMHGGVVIGAASSDIVVIGAIAAYGDIVVHETGFRAQKARVVAVVASHPLTASGRRLRDFYGARVVSSVAELVDVAREFGVLRELPEVEKASAENFVGEPIRISTATEPEPPAQAGQGWFWRFAHWAVGS